jgi:hypothetical protein
MLYFTCNVGDNMGYFSNVSQDVTDNEDNEFALKDKMLKIIIKVYPEKTYRDLSSVDYESIRGLYAQACKVLKRLEETEENEKRGL